MLGAPGRASTFTGRSTSATTRRMSSRSARPGAYEHVGTRLLERLEPGDRVGEIGIAADLVLHAGR